jgi:DNA replication licensing factor MCM7
MRESGAAATGGSRGELDMRRVRERVLAKGFTAQQLEACLNEYADLDVSDRPVSHITGGYADVILQIWQTASEGARLVFIETGEDDMDDDDEF